MPDLSVVIPTRDRPCVLRDCLATLSKQALDAELEVIVVDDGSRTPLAQSLASDVRPLAVRFERQPPAGLNAARNRGVEIASGEVVAFLDDDTLVADGWAQAILNEFADRECDAAGGRVELLLELSAPRWLSAKLRSYLAEFDRGLEPCWLDDGPVPVGANCAVRRRAFEHVGRFRVELDRVGASLVSNGDTEFFRRLRERGHRIRYAPAAKVMHRVPAERLTLDFFRRRAFAQGVSDELLLAIGGRPRGLRRRAREVGRLGRALPILAKGLVEGRGGAGALIWIAYCRGRLASVGRSAGEARALDDRATATLDTEG